MRLSKGYRNGDIKASSAYITQNARLYLTETTRLFTQLWASLQSGEADGGAVRRSLIRLKVLRSHKPMMHKFGTTP